ncbi:MAG: hypothetical protein GY820_05930, partial [Gammaproteobacteria bacterium]|nr:hypothetical protein [Gammaproteobacteria bacterium]
MDSQHQNESVFPANKGVALLVGQHKIKTLVSAFQGNKTYNQNLNQTRGTT